MEKWINNNAGKLVVLFGILLISQVATYAWRQPAEFRSSIIPKLQSQIIKYDSISAKNEALISGCLDIKRNQEVIRMMLSNPKVLESLFE